MTNRGGLENGRLSIAAKERREKWPRTGSSRCTTRRHHVRKIIVDRETGVNYLLASTNKTSGVGMSVLVDAEGKPVVTPVDKLNS